MSAGVFILGFGAALDYLRRTDAPPSDLKSLVKTVSTGALALLALVVGGPWALVWGLALGAAGDFFLSRAGERAFLAGLISFALSHVAYVVLFRQLPGAGALFELPFVAWLMAGALLVMAASTARWLLPFAGALKGPVAGYVAIISAMGFAALHLPVGFGLAGGGALLFILSDLVLSVQLFRLREGTAAHRQAGLTLWLLYWGGQALICLGTLWGLGLSI